MHKVYFLLFLLLMGTIVSAQRKETIHQRQLVIPPTQNTRLHSKGETTFNESGFIPVKKGDSIFIQPDVIYPAKNHHILRGVIKTLGWGALAYQTNKSLHPFQGNTNKGNVNQQGNKSFIPALGVGLALSYPDFVGKHSKSKPYLKYLLYGKDSTLISQKVVQLNKKTRLPITGEVEKDGYIKVLLADNSESNTVSNDLALNIQSVDANSSSVTKLISTDTTAQNVLDSTILTSDTTVSVSKLAAIRAFDEDDGEENSGGNGGGYSGGSGDGGDGSGDGGDGSGDGSSDSSSDGSGDGSYDSATDMFTFTDDAGNTYYAYMDAGDSITFPDGVTVTFDGTTFSYDDGAYSMATVSSDGVTTTTSYYSGLTMVGVTNPYSMTVDVVSFSGDILGVTYDTISLAAKAESILKGLSTGLTVAGLAISGLHAFINIAHDLYTTGNASLSDIVTLLLVLIAVLGMSVGWGIIADLAFSIGVSMWDLYELIMGG